MLCNHHFLIKRKKLFGWPNTRYRELLYNIEIWKKDTYRAKISSNLLKCRIQLQEEQEKNKQILRSPFHNTRKTEFSDISRKSIESNRAILTAENFAFARKTTMFYDFIKSGEINILRSAVATMA